MFTSSLGGENLVVGLLCVQLAACGRAAHARGAMHAWCMHIGAPIILLLPQTQATG